MPSRARDWKREDAEKAFVDLLDDAKHGRMQRILDVDGIFELAFRRRNGMRAGDVLASDGPDDDE